MRHKNIIKVILSYLLISLVVFNISACGRKNQASEETGEDINTETDNETNIDSENFGTDENENSEESLEDYDFETEIPLTTTGALYEDYKNGKLNTDEYAQYLLYAIYEADKLPGEYAGFDNPDLVHIDDFLYDHYDELSDETLMYYYNKYNLVGSIFDPDIYEDSSFDNQESNMFVTTVHAEDGIATEDFIKNIHVVGSPEKKIFVWYTHLGKDGVDPEVAERIAYGLEESIDKYDELFGTQFQVKVEVTAKNSLYFNQMAVMGLAGFTEEDYMNALHVYIMEYEESLAQYNGLSPVVLKIYYKLQEGYDIHSMIAAPYILIRPSSFEDYERLEQLYNHELMHHYQQNVFRGILDYSDRKKMDLYGKDSTANWASTLISNKTNENGYLNEHSAIATSMSDYLTTQDFIDTYGEDNVPYYLHVYLYNYMKTVPDSKQIIIDAMYEDSFLGYLANHCNMDQRVAIQEETMLRQLDHNYDNMNLVQDPTINNQVTVRDTFTGAAQLVDLTMPYLGIRYYEVEQSDDHDLQITFYREDESLNAYLVGMKNEEYKIIDCYTVGDYEDNIHYDFSTANIGEWDKLYFVVANTNPTKDERYTIDVQTLNKTDVMDVYVYENVTKDNLRENGQFSIRYTSSFVDDDAEATIYTFYYDGDKVNRWVVTDVYREGTDEAWIDSCVRAIEENSIEYKNNVIKNGRVVTYEYTDAAIQRYNVTVSEIFDQIDMFGNFYGASEFVDFGPAL